jgi:hypothetical protein
VDPAEAPVQDGLGKALAPPRGRLGPLAGPAKVGQLVAGVHQVAVDRPGPERAQLVGERRQHGLVQQGHAIADPALLEQRPALAEHADGDQVGVGEPGRHRGAPWLPCLEVLLVGLLEGGQRLVHLAEAAWWLIAGCTTNCGADRPVVRFARLIHRPVRVPGGP